MKPRSILRVVTGAPFHGKGGTFHSWVIKLTAVLVLFSNAQAFPEMSISFGEELSALNWRNGSHASWGFNVSLGPEISRNLFLKGKISYPLPTLIVVGNQFSAGGELVWIPVASGHALSLKASLAASWCAMWPEHIIVILADGDTNEPPAPDPFEDASGIRYEALAGLGCTFDMITLWLNLGVDHRRMKVSIFENGEFTEENLRFTGPCFGLSTEIRF